MENVPTLSTSTELQEWPQDAIPKKWIDKLFNEMKLTFGQKFITQWQVCDPQEMKLHWACQLAKLSNEEMRRGVSAMRNSEFPPTLPEFLKFCRPSIDPMTAYYQAVEGMSARERGELGNWAHPAIYWAAGQVSAFDLKNQTYSQIRHRWEQALREQMDKGKWPAVPVPMVALPPPGKSVLSREAATKMVDELKASDVVKSVTAMVDHLRWARKILERQAAKDQTLPSISVKFARYAPGMTA